MGSAQSLSGTLGGESEREREEKEGGREARGGASSGVEGRRERRGCSEGRMSTELLAGVWYC